MRLEGTGSTRLRPIAALAVVALAGCGGTTHQANSGRRVTVPDAVFPAQTITAPDSSRPDGPACRRLAGTIARDSLMFLAHSGSQGVYPPADLYYAILRSPVAEFQVRTCDPKLLGSVLVRSLTARQRTELVAGLPASMASTMREGLGSVGSR